VALLQQLDRARLDSDYLGTFARLHADLRRHADTTAAAAVFELLEDRGRLVPAGQNHS
jgi:hypothetical protein